MPANVSNQNRQREFEHTGVRRGNPPDVVQEIAVRTADLERVRYEETQPRSTNSMDDVASPRRARVRTRTSASRDVPVVESTKRSVARTSGGARRRTGRISTSPSTRNESIRVVPRQNPATAARASKSASGALTSQSRADRERRTVRRYECLSRDTTSVTHARRTLRNGTVNLVDVDAPSSH